MADNTMTIAGKRILLIALSGYSKGIVKQMQDMGALVDYVNDKPNDGFICKALGRAQFGFYQKVLDKYYQQKIAELSGKDYDYILIIRGEYTPIASLLRLREAYPNAKLVLYMWDGMDTRGNKNISRKWKHFDKVLTFDRIDYEAHKGQIEFLPLYYYDAFLPSDAKDPNADDFKYDISFIGTGHKDRVRIVKEIMKQCEDNGKKTYSYVFMPFYLIFLFNKITNPDFKGVKRSEISFRKLPFEFLYSTYADSRCVVDVEHPGQHGLTMRSIEIIGLKRKFITTNKDIVNYDFYNENNILVVDRKNPVVDMSFFDSPYEKLPDEMYEKYSLSSWIINVLS